jgi:hypothetical protein
MWLRDIKYTEIVIISLAIENFRKIPYIPSYSTFSTQMPTFNVCFTFHLIPNFNNCLVLDLCHEEVYFLLYDILFFLSFIVHHNFLIKIFQLSSSGKTVITSDDALKLESVPERIAIVGSGYIGLEFSDVYTALGSQVNTSL